MEDVLDFAPLVRKYTWNKSEDVKSEAWLAVVEAKKSYDPTKRIPFAGYVKSRVKYSVWNMVRKQQRRWRREVSIESEGKNENSKLIDSLSCNLNVTDQVMHRFLIEDVRTVINLLPERQRMAVVKTVVCGHTQTEAAVELGVTPQAIFKLRKRGLSRLKRHLERM